MLLILHNPRFSRTRAAPNDIRRAAVVGVELEGFQARRLEQSGNVGGQPGALSWRVLSCG